MRVFQNAKSLFVLACTGILICACGDSGNSSTTDDPELDEDPAKEIEVDSKVSGSTVIRDRIYNSSIGSYMNTVQFGIYIWLEDNSTEIGYSGNSMCYDDDPENCYTYGRLYSPGAPKCPSGFSVPSQDDWSGTMRYLGKYSELDTIFGFPRGGYCFDSFNGLVCSDKDDAGYYLAGDSVVAVVKGRSVSFKPAGLGDFYQLRCLKYSYIVPTVDDLPTCDTISQRTLRTFYVMSKKSDYRCIGTRWVDDFTNNCSHVEDGTYGVYHDSMYICKYNEWDLADISDSKDKCTSSNEHTTYLFNGVYYACEDGAWRELTSTEKKLGYCKPDLYGTIDSTLYMKEDAYFGYDSLYNYYTCDSLGWRESVLSDFAGECDSSKMYDEFKFKKKSYVCRGDSWDAFSSLEQDVGICSPKKQGVIDSSDGYGYICDSTTWRYATKDDYLGGECTSKRSGEIRAYGSDKYICRDSVWNKLSALEAELGLCDTRKMGILDTTESETIYYCDSTGWRSAKIGDIGGECNASNKYKMVELNGYTYYCYDSSWHSTTSLEDKIGVCWDKNKNKIDSVTVKGKHYYCDADGWRELDSYEVKFGICTAALEGASKTFDGAAYTCTSGKWTYVKAAEYLGKCDSLVWGKTKTYDEKEYVCKFTSWVTLTDFDKKYGVCSGKTLGTTVIADGINYICTSSDWSKTSNPVASLGDCTYKDSTVYKTDANGIYYACHNYTWTKVTSIVTVFGSCNYKNREKQVVFNGAEYVCDSVALGAGWHKLSAIDSLRGYCSNKKLGDTITYKNDRYLCKSTFEGNRWTVVGYREFMGECTVAREGHKMFNGINYSVCSDERWEGVTETYKDPRDNNTYRIQKINGVTWMLDNLNYVTADSSDCVNGTSSCGTAGRLYGFSAAKTACPTGWSLPDTAAWGAMIDYVYALDTAYKRKVGGSIFWNPTEDIYGFAMLPTGYEYFFLQNGQDPVTKHDGNTGIDDAAVYWRADGSYEAWGRVSFKTGGGTGQGKDARMTKTAVRCIKED